MPVEPNAAVEITALSWVPDFAKGVVRDLRVRWALEEVGASYRERLFHGAEERSAEYLREQPFNQVPAYSDGEVRMFETGAIVLWIAEGSETLMPRDPQGRARAMSWTVAALNSLEPSIQQVVSLDLFHAGAPWRPGAREAAVGLARMRLNRLAQRLSGRDYLEDRFTCGDLMTSTVLRILKDTEVLADYPVLTAYRERCEARPAFGRALQAQLDAFTGEAPAGWN